MNPPVSVPALFAQAMELDAEARRAWLARLHREDERLASEIEGLLAAFPAGERRFDSPAWEREPALDIETPTPERVGPYPVLAEIGRGGMGRVFLADQAGEGFERQIALKVMATGGGGKDRSPLPRGSRILACLEHPGIARFYDAGRDGERHLVPGARVRRGRGSARLRATAARARNGFASFFRCSTRSSSPTAASSSTAISSRAT